MVVGGGVEVVGELGRKSARGERRAHARGLDCTVIVLVRFW